MAKLGDLSVLAEQNPGEASLAFDLFQHLWPQPAYVGDRETTTLGRVGPRLRALNRDSGRVRFVG